jgi:hypothetical protein
LVFGREPCVRGKGFLGGDLFWFILFHGLFILQDYWFLWTKPVLKNCKKLVTVLVPLQSGRNRGAG